LKLDLIESCISSSYVQRKRKENLHNSALIVMPLASLSLTVFYLYARHVNVLCGWALYMLNTRTAKETEL